MTLGYQGPDWQSTIHPTGVPNPKFHGVDVWPEGAGSDSGGGNKNPLTDGYHPFLAIGPKANRAENTLVGVVVNFVADVDQAELVITRGFAAKASVANVLTYAAGVPATWVAAITVGTPVYVDDSDDLTADVTLTFSPLNDLVAANPRAGIVWYDQDEYDDSGVGGVDGKPFPIAVAEDETVYTELTIMLDQR